MFIDDDKLPEDVVRKKYSDTRDALCCLNCGFESDFDPTVQGSLCISHAQLQRRGRLALRSHRMVNHEHLLAYEVMHSALEAVASVATESSASSIDISIKPCPAS
jgi:hypothetical protein